jgi:hypothetical protein
MPDNRVYDVSAMTDSELERPPPPDGEPQPGIPGLTGARTILAHISAIDAELAKRARRPAT